MGALHNIEHTERLFLQKNNDVFRKNADNMINNNVNGNAIPKRDRSRQTKDFFTYMVAHDLKNPLSTIGALGAIIRENIEEGDQSEALFNLSLLEKTSQLSMGIIADLLLIGELENSNFVTDKINVISSLESVLELLQIKAGMKGITIQHEFLNNPVFVNGHENYLKRVFQNLLTNAIKFSHKGSDIQVSIRKEVFSVLIKIQDTGIGIPLEMQDSVFDLFTASKRRGTEGEATTGLGLYISKQIIDNHKGQIWLESKLDEGTVFYIRLPVLNDNEYNF